MRIRYIEIFHAVMQAGTVKGAADMLHITQPAATRLLQQAEQHVGVALFQRVRGRLVPTAEAHQLIPEVEQLYLKLDAVRRITANLGRHSHALLRVLCVPGLALEALPQALGRWSVKHAQVRLTLRTLHSRQIAESLVLREADIGFAFEPSNHPALVNEVIAAGRMVAVGKDLPRSTPWWTSILLTPWGGCCTWLVKHKTLNRWHVSLPTATTPPLNWPHTALAGLWSTTTPQLMHSVTRGCVCCRWIQTLPFLSTCSGRATCLRVRPSTNWPSTCARFCCKRHETRIAGKPAVNPTVCCSVSDMP
jgi:DNA-binding transcriptional LysR family regulator